MAQVLLIRHAAHDLLGNTLAGRTRDIALNAQGAAQARELATRLQHADITALVCSPRLRARQTIAPLASALERGIEVDARFDEIDFGEWSGRTFAELVHAPGWSTWCEQRSQARPPGGETIAEVQARAVDAITALGRDHGAGTVAIVSHGDVIKAAVAAYLGSSLDALERFDIAPASVTVIAIVDAWAQVTRVNDTGPIGAARG